MGGSSPLFLEIACMFGVGLSRFSSWMASSRRFRTWTTTNFLQVPWRFLMAQVSVNGSDPRSFMNLSRRQDRHHGYATVRQQRLCVTLLLLIPSPARLKQHHERLQPVTLPPLQPQPN